MDAISFVVGMQSKDLRGKQLKDLVYRASAEDTGAPPPAARLARGGAPPLRDWPGRARSQRNARLR